MWVTVIILHFLENSTITEEFVLANQVCSREGHLTGTTWSTPLRLLHVLTSVSEYFTCCGNLEYMLVIAKVLASTMVKLPPYWREWQRVCVFSY